MSESMKLPPHLLEALECVVNNEGEDIDWAFGCRNRGTSQSYMSRLKKRGLAYTNRYGSTIEVWATYKGRRLLHILKPKNPA